MQCIYHTVTNNAVLPVLVVFEAVSGTLHVWNLLCSVILKGRQYLTIFQIEKLKLSLDQEFEPRITWLHSHTWWSTHHAPETMGFKCSFLDWFLGTGSQNIATSSKAGVLLTVPCRLALNGHPCCTFSNHFYIWSFSSFQRPSAMSLCHTINHGALTSCLRAKDH